MKNNNVIYSNEYKDIILINPDYPFMVLKKNGAGIVPYDKNNNIYLLHKYREGIGTYYEIPRGFVEKNENFKEGAIRELFEETGLVPKEIIELGNVQPDTGSISVDVKIYGILIEEIPHSYEYYDNTDKEINKVIKLTFKEINKLLLSGEIVCGYTLSSLFMLKAKLNNK